jgi:hypothetical protein
MKTIPVFKDQNKTRACKRYTEKKFWKIITRWEPGNGYAAGEPEVVKKRKELSVFTSREGLVYDQALGILS